MKFLLIPENNSLSHITKCLALRDILQAHCHEVHIAVGKKHACFLSNLGISHHLLPDIQETDQGGFPSFKWFSNIETVTNCIEAEVALLNKLKPDRVLGVFRFTLYASAKITNTPYDSLICGCMMPDSDEVLGFSKNEPGRDLQKTFLDNFFRYAGMKTSRAFKKFGLNALSDIRLALKGDRTFLWDFPEFMPLQTDSTLIHVGPIALHHWPYDSINLDHILDTNYPLAVVSFGTCVTDNATVLRIVKLLLDLGYKVIVAAGGQAEMFEIKESDPRVTVLKYAPLNIIFPYTSLLVTHGGQMTVFEALQNKIPVFVMPLQPEQAHNGVCLERIGCGNRLIPPTNFIGLFDDYINAFNQMSDDAIKTKINTLINNTNTKENLSRIKEAIECYHGAHTLANLLEVN